MSGPQTFAWARSSLVTPWVAAGSGSATRRLAVDPTRGERGGAEPRVLAVSWPLAEIGTWDNAQAWPGGDGDSTRRNRRSSGPPITPGATVGPRSGRPGRDGVGPFAWVPADFELRRPSSVRLVSSARRSRGATTSGRWRPARRRSGLAGKGKERLVRGCIRRPMGHPPGPTTRTAVRGAPALREKLVSSSGRQKAKARRFLSLPLLTYSALGGLRQDPGRGAESSAEATTCGNGGTTCVCCCRRMGDAVTSNRGGTGGAVAGAWGGGAGVRAARPGERPADSSEGRQPGMRTCSTRGSTELEAPVIRSASAVQRSTAASEVSQ